MILGFAFLVSIVSANFLPKEVENVEGVPEDAHLSFKELCAKYSYPYEENEVTTDDGYILTILRIPGASGTTGPYPSKPVVFL
jgi:pimeloyl-ACP methyl ester carboxylesterase